MALLLVMVGNMQNLFSSFQNTSDKVFIGHQEPGLDKGSVPDETLRCLVFILPMKIFGSILQSSQQSHVFPGSSRGGGGRQDGTEDEYKLPYWL